MNPRGLIFFGRLYFNHFLTVRRFFKISAGQSNTISKASDSSTFLLFNRPARAIIIYFCAASPVA